MTSWVIHRFSEVDSTQRLAKEGAMEGAADYSIWLAERQSAGRGRQGRRWKSPVGGLWFSLLIRPSLSPPQVPGLTFLACLVLSKTVQRCTGLVTDIKWPNDLVIQKTGIWRKIGGILTESALAGGHLDWVVMGVGVNVNNAIPEELQSKAISIKGLTQTELEIESLLSHFLSDFKHACECYILKGFGPFRESYRDRAMFLGQKVEVQTAEGVVYGKACDVDEDGSLLIQCENSAIKRVNSGELTVR